MKRAFANLLLGLATWLGARRVTINVMGGAYSPAVSEAILAAAPWEPDHAAEWAKYLATANGQVLSARLRRITAEVAINGAQDRLNTIHAAGVSAGWDECVRYLHSLSRVSRVSDTQPNAEQALEDEAQLLERLSP